MTTALACTRCGAELRLSAKFCDECGSPTAVSRTPAEYKQVTVLFADVVHSMDIAAAVGTERLREIMTELVTHAAAVVQRYGGTVDKFTGNGIMPVFGAPAALEDHSLRACLAALGVQEEVTRMPTEVERRDGVNLELRVGLNSGQVIAGEIGSAALGYTTIGEQVGMAQRMESVALPGAVMLSESTARLVKGAANPVPAQRLLGVPARDQRTGSSYTTLVGREWELTTLAAMLDRSTAGRGSVVAVVGPPGIGKTRLTGEALQLSKHRGVEVFSTFCESHATDIPFHVVARLLRSVGRLSGLDDQAARAQLRMRFSGADPQDLALLDDLLGIADPDMELPKIDPDARRRRLTALINTAQLARSEPGVLVVGDAHWIDDVSESMLADFLAMIPQTPSLVLITYRPEYRGALAHLAGAQTINLAPLAFSDTTALVRHLLGPDPSVAPLAAQITERAAGNPLFVEEMVRDLTDRGVLQGVRGAHVNTGGSGDVTVPATVHAAIAARIDRIDSAAKATLNAAAVIGVRFGTDLLAALADTSTLPELVHAEVVGQLTFTPTAQYAFRQPLIRAVAYQSQLKAERTTLHRRLAAALAERDPTSADENAALIAEHLEAAADLQAAFGWHMRAGTWLQRRDIRAARMSWQRARQVADQLPSDEAGRAAMQIAPRTLLCLSAWRVGDSVTDGGFEELQALATAADDKASLTIGMAGQMLALVAYGHYQQAADMVRELVNLVDSVGDSVLSNGLLLAALTAKFGTGEMTEVLQLADQIIADT